MIKNWQAPRWFQNISEKVPRNAASVSWGVVSLQQPRTRYDEHFNRTRLLSLGHNNVKSSTLACRRTFTTLFSLPKAKCHSPEHSVWHSDIWSIQPRSSRAGSTSSVKEKFHVPNARVFTQWVRYQGVSGVFTVTGPKRTMRSMAHTQPPTFGDSLCQDGTKVNEWPMDSNPLYTPREAVFGRRLSEYQLEAGRDKSRDQGIVENDDIADVLGSDYHSERPSATQTMPLRGFHTAVNSFKPQEIVNMLNEHIIGQYEAKRALANALRNRWRRQQIHNVEMRDDILPKNILMVGPTGVGKTEIARRMAKLVDAPFIKVEATKYTEVGFHGRDVDTIIKDLVESAIRRQYVRLETELFPQAQRMADEKLLRALAGQVSIEADQEMYKSLKRGRFNNQTVTLDVPYSLSSGLFSSDPSGSNSNECCPNTDFSFFPLNRPMSGASVWTPGSSSSLGGGNGGGGMSWKFSGYSNSQGKERTEKRTMTIKEARVALCHIEFGRMMGSVAKSRITQQALEAVEQEGIVFLDEIDKICSSKSHSYSGPDASAEGVQRDLLPLIEGTTVSTPYGNVRTSYILFIASGAFHSVKPSDMMAELQGRLPVRVQLKPLTEEDFRQILFNTRNNLIEQNIALLATEGVTLLFERSAILEIARSAYEINSFVENIGARRLITIIEKVMEEISFVAPDMDSGSLVRVTEEVVRRAVEPLTTKSDLHKFIL